MSTIPAGVRVYAVGDIHGRLDLLDQLLEMIEARERARPVSRTILIFLGDYIDRGPDSAGVVERLLSGLPRDIEAVFLRGNHEDMMMACFEAVERFDFWAMNGGLATARSYGVEIDMLSGSGEIDAFDVLHRLGRALPPAHRAFLSSLPVSYEIGGYFFVHAGVRPGVALNAQTEHDCLFIREAFLNHEGGFEKIVVHGHTPVPQPEVRPNRIGIDTGAFFTGRLTALCLEGASKAFLTTAGYGDL